MLPCENRLLPIDDVVSEQVASVLIVDDDDLATEELSETLELEGFTCLTASTSSGALDRLEANPGIQVVITDFYLRGADSFENGLDLIEKIRSKFPGRELEFIVVSGDRDVLADCTITGAGTFLAKPVAPESLCSLVRQASGDPAGADAADAQDEDSILVLQNMVRAQAGAIANLTAALKGARDGTRQANSRLDRLVSAASIAKRRNDQPGGQDIGELIGYIAGQGYAVKKLLKRASNDLETPGPTLQSDT